MKAIVKVKKGSVYSNFNGLTFEVEEINSTFVRLDINGISTDFLYTEVIIVDIQKEYQKAFDNYNFNGDSTVIRLQTYATKNTIL